MRKDYKRVHLNYIHHFVVMAVLSTVIHFWFFAKGTALLPSGIAGALSGSIPIFAFVLSALFLHDEKGTWLKFLGIMFGFIGVTLIANPFATPTAGSTSLAGIFYLLGGSAAVGASFVYTKKYLSPLGISAAALTAYQLGIGLLIMLPLIDFAGINDVWQSPKAVASTVLGLGLLNTGIASIAYYYIVAQLGAIRAAAVTYVPPVVAMLIAMFYLGENMSLLDYIAVGLIFMGMFLMRENRKI